VAGGGESGADGIKMILKGAEEAGSNMLLGTLCNFQHYYCKLH